MYSGKLISKTIDTWQAYSALPLSQEDAIEILNNTINFFELLIELDQKYQKGGD